MLQRWLRNVLVVQTFSNNFLTHKERSVTTCIFGTHELTIESTWIVFHNTIDFSNLVMLIHKQSLSLIILLFNRLLSSSLQSLLLELFPFDIPCVWNRFNNHRFIQWISERAHRPSSDVLAALCLLLLNIFQILIQVSCTVPKSYRCLRCPLSRTHDQYSGRILLKTLHDIPVGKRYPFVLYHSLLIHVLIDATRAIHHLGFYAPQLTELPHPLILKSTFIAHL